MTRPTLANWEYEENRGYGEADMPPELWDAQQAVLGLHETFRARRRERLARHPVPEILYHYTNLRGLQGMLESFTLWLSDAAFMNDPLEGTWVHKRAVALAAEVLGESPLASQTHGQIEAQLTAPDLWDQSLRGEEEPGDAHAAAMQNAFMPAFIASFTEKGDLLSQWRGYGAGGDGVSIGFDLNQLDFSKIENLPGEFIRPTVVKVEYDEDRQDEEVRWIFSSIRRVYEEHIEVLSLNANASRRFTWLFYDVVRDALYWLRWEFKSPYYAEEEEWRIVANPHGVMRRKSRVGNGHIVPYLEMPLPQIAAPRINRLAIPRIVLGPRCQQSVLRSIRGLLTNIAYPEVVRSRLSLR